MGLRFGVLALAGVLLLGIGTPPLVLPLDGSVGPASPSCHLRFRQPLLDWVDVSPVTRSTDAVSYYDYFSVSAHTEFVEPFASKAYMYLDPTTGILSFIVHHNIDDGGSPDADVDFDFVDLPAGVAVTLSDDPGELRLGRNPEGQWDFFLNTDGGILSPFPSDSEWGFTIVPSFGGPDPMTAWRFVDGSGSEQDLVMAGSLQVENACNAEPAAAAGGPYGGTEGAPITFDAGGSTDPDGDDLTYEWDFDGDGTFDTVPSSSPTADHSFPDDFSGAARVRVSDGELTSESTASVAIANVPPQIVLAPVVGIGEGGTAGIVAIVSDPGADDLSVTWSVEGLGSETRDYPAGSGPTTVTDATFWTIGDDGAFGVTVTATDDDGGSTETGTTLDVANLPPTVVLEAIEESVGVRLRIAGEKWHDVRVTLHDSAGTDLATGSITRVPGSPDDQTLDLGAAGLSPDGGLTARVEYTPADDPVNGQGNGATPAWLILTFADGTERRLHHTFNVRHPDTYVWEADLLALVAARGFRFTATAGDPGSDDLTFAWSLPAGTVVETAFNDGASPDPAKSPGGTFPFGASSIVRVVFPDLGSPGVSYVIAVLVMDDDGGSTAASLVIPAP